MKRINTIISDEANDKLIFIQKNNKIRLKDEVIERVIMNIDKNIKLK